MTTSQSCQDGHCWCTLTTRGMRSCCRCGETYAVAAQTITTTHASGDTVSRVATIDTGGTGPADQTAGYVSVRMALKRLRNECAGMLGAFRQELISAISITNVRVLERTVADADAALATCGTGQADLVPLYELQQRQDAERIASLTKTLERLVTGRRRCGIREHRKQIRGLQKQLAFATREMLDTRQQYAAQQKTLAELRDECVKLRRGTAAPLMTIPDDLKRVIELTARAERAEAELAAMKKYWLK